MLLLSAFTVVALLLAAVGIMGVPNDSRTQRTQDVGMRMAHGARGTDVLGLVLRGSWAPCSMESVQRIPPF